MDKLCSQRYTSFRGSWNILCAHPFILHSESRLSFFVYFLSYQTR